MRQTLTIITFIFLLPLLAAAQSNFRPGLVVTTQGDTLRGYIDYREWRNSPETITFRTTPDAGTAQQLTPENSRYLEVSGLEAYQQYHGPISMDQIQYNHLTVGPDTSRLTATVFMKVVSTGKNLRLLSYTDNIKTRFFLAERPQGQVYELGYRKYFVNTNQGRKVNTLNLYAGQLVLAAAKYGPVSEELKQQIFGADYSTAALAAVVAAINGAQKPVSEKAGSRPSSLRFFVGAGLTASNARFKGAEVMAASGGPQTTLAPTLILGFDKFANPNTRRLFFRAELSYTAPSHFDFYAREHRYGSTLSYYDHNYSFSQQTLSASPQVMYHLYAKGNIRFYAGVGAGFNLSAYAGNEYKITYIINAEQGVALAPDKTPDYASFNTLWMNFSAKAGLVLFDRAEVAFAYAPPVPIAHSANYTLMESCLQVGFRYYLTR
ncbi:hypothetical protein [Pontibacter liquoris]|uniref:hypothetical protein n=1 Tax=Pontibacter liquoris TaxID=2905677 RepID=UPI001FA6B9E2|nr:hypothetical protein [Pontibacter liquoris]